MGGIRLVSDRKRELRPLVEAALANELRLLEAGIRQGEERLKAFEEKYHASTRELISRYEEDEVEESESLEIAEWIGEYRLLERLREKAETVREIRFEN